MALSNKTLSGCLDPTLASGLTDFLLVQAMVITSNMPNTTINGMRRDIEPRTSDLLPVGTAALGCPPSTARPLHVGRLGAPFLASFARTGPLLSEARRDKTPITHQTRLSASPLLSLPSTMLAYSVLDRHSRTQRCLRPEFLLPPEPHQRRYRAPHRRLLRCGNADRAGCEFPLISSFCAAWTE